VSAPDRRTKLDRDHPTLSIRRQCALLGVARSGVYRRCRPANDDDLALMRRIDELFLRWPFLGSRRMVAMLAAEGIRVNRKRVRRLMRLMGIVPLGPKPRTSKPGAGHKIYPYLLGGLVIDRPNQVWCADITYLPIGRGFLYLVAIMDWHSRAVLAWRVSNTMDTGFCVSALEAVLARFGKPEIFNTDSQKIEASSRVQGSQFTSTEFTGALAQAGIKISMDGKGRWMDNVFIERLWRSLKYEDVYIKGYADGTELRAGLAEWMGFYNHHRPHQALGNRAPMAIWREAMIGALPPMAVDMMLAVAASLDDATASTTSPQPQQQQKAA
jgi:putative transposase